MKRVGRLWPELTSLTHLLESIEAAAVGKRRRPDVAAFRLNLETEVLQLRRELWNWPGGSSTASIPSLTVGVR